MARPRKPTALLELTGAFDKNPNRKRPDEPKESRPLGDPNNDLPEDVVACWHEIDDIACEGVLKRSDRLAVEIMAQLMAKFRRSRNKSSVQAILELVKRADLDADQIEALIVPLIERESMTSTELATLRSLIGSFGMTSAERSKLSVPTQEKPASRFAKLAALPGGRKG